MDKYDPNRDLNDKAHKQSETTTPRLPPAPLTASNFYKELVQFAIFVGIVLVPVIHSFSELTGSVQGFVSNYIVHYENGQTVPASEHTISKALTRVILILLFFLIFTTIFFIRHAIRRRRRLGNVDSIADDTTFATKQLNERDEQLQRLERRLQQQMTYLKKIHAQMYQDRVRVRHDFVLFKSLYIIDKNGDIRVQKHVILTSVELEVHFWRFYIAGEDCTKPIDDLNELNLQLRPTDNEFSNVLELVLEDRPLRKMFTANFLPAISPREERGFEVEYQWPGFFNELIEKGSTRYFWDTTAYSSNLPANFDTEWRFDPSYGEVTCDIVGANPEGMRLTRETNSRGTVWRYVGEQVAFGNMPLELYFSLANR